MVPETAPLPPKPRVRRRFLVGCLIVLGAVAAIARADDPLSLTEAERMALARDPAVAASLARAEALATESVADAQLPDPKFRTGLYNLPLDDFDIEKVPTTQWRFGLQQQFPRGDTLRWKSRQALAKSEAARRKAELEQWKIRRDVRKTWLDAWREIAVAKIIQDSRRLFENLIDITQVQYGSGESSQQDVLRAELELSRLDDRISKVKTREESARARLSRWLGDSAWRPLSGDTPALPEPPDEQQILERLPRHPRIKWREALIEARQQGVNIARAQYKPGWMVGAEYRKRFGDNPDGSNREDMAAIMLSVDLPLFPDKRQDKRLAASKQRAEAIRLTRNNDLRILRQQLALDEARQKRLDERLQRYQNRLLKQARENADAALEAYQSGSAEFTNLMRARITELEVRIQALKIRVDLLKTRADLLYLAGDATGEDS